MDPWTLAALSGVKMFSDARQADRNNEMRALELQWSPWTKIAPREEKYADGLNTAMSGYAAGLSQEAADKDAALKAKLSESQIKYLNSVTPQKPISEKPQDASNLLVPQALWDQLFNASGKYTPVA